MTKTNRTTYDQYSTAETRNHPSDLEKIIPLKLIKHDGETQTRAAIHHKTVLEYAQDLKNGDKFPPVVVFDDGKYLWLSDGFHRFEAYEAAEITEIPAIIKKGTKRDAILYSVGANAKHGLRRTNADKRRAVMTLLMDEEWNQWSARRRRSFADREIARRCAVHHQMVGKWRAAKRIPSGSSLDDSSSERTYMSKYGTVTQMNTTNIGKNLSGEIPQLESLTHPPPKKKSSKTSPSLPTEGINYKPGNPGYGCEWYVRVEQETYQRLQQYQQKMGTATLDGTITRMLDQKQPKSSTPPSDDICLSTIDNLQLLNEKQLEKVVEAIAARHPYLIYSASRAINLN